MAIKNRIKELRNVKGSELILNPKNWRTHPMAQRDALRGVIKEVGYADALIARDTDEGLILLDGHLRAEITPEDEIPVLVLDVTEEEADIILATLDPLSAMANSDFGQLSKLIESLDIENDDINDLLDDLLGNTTDPDDEWEGMPEYESEDISAWHTVKVHFKDQEALDHFSELVGQSLTDTTKFIWHPAMIVSSYLDKRYVSES
jgi:hypothetical protein